MPLPILPDAIRAAHERIRAYIRRTPLLSLDPVPGPAAITLKLELLQAAGSFKARGAFNNLLARAVPAAGVCAASGGNHGIAVALAAQRLGHPATIFVPEISAPVKVAAIQRHGARVVRGGARYADAQLGCDRHAVASGALLVHPFNGHETMAAQGTLALEWDEDQARLGLGALDTVLIAVGGGGLIGGAAAWWHQRVKVVGVEPEGSRCLHAALAAGHPVDVSVESIAADSLGARRVGDLAFAIARAAVDHVALVTDDAIRAAHRHLWTNYRIAAELGGSAAFAAILGGAYQPSAGERVGVLVCGGNVDPAAMEGL